MSKCAACAVNDTCSYFGHFGEGFIDHCPYFSQRYQPTREPPPTRSCRRCARLRRECCGLLDQCSRCGDFVEGEPALLVLSHPPVKRSCDYVTITIGRSVFDWFLDGKWYDATPNEYHDPLLHISDRCRAALLPKEPTC